MAHRNARLNVRGRLLLVERVLRAAQPHAPERVGVSPGVHLEPGACRRACALPRVLQHSPQALRSGRSNPDQPTVTNVTA